MAGPRAFTKLNEAIKARLQGICEKGYDILIGDANGADKAIQQYFSDVNYPNVTIYASNGKARNNTGNWQVEAVPVPANVRGFDFYAMKDKAMAANADYGFMIWNGKSKGTLSNIINLLNQEKKTLIYFTPQSKFINITTLEKLKTLIEDCPPETKELFEQLHLGALPPSPHELFEKSSTKNQN
jgi:hypothetical protein